MAFNHAVAQFRSLYLPLQNQSGALNRKSSPYYSESHSIFPEYIHIEGTICSVHALAFFVQTYFQDLLLNKSIQEPKNNEKIQWSTCQGDSSGLEEGIPRQSWCPCLVYLARTCMQHVPILTQLYLQTSYHLSSIAYYPHCNNNQPRPTNGIFSLGSQLKSLTYLMVRNMAIMLLERFYCAAYHVTLDLIVPKPRLELSGQLFQHRQVCSFKALV
jgi:hypothetical protein